MRALLLNSGLGSRMGKQTEDKPKCMCSIGNGHSIISWQLELLRRNDIREVIVTTGPFPELLEKHVLFHANGLDVIFVNNPVYTRTNYIYSMFLAKEYLQGDIILLHGDLVMEPTVLRDLVYSINSTVTVDCLLPLSVRDFKARLDSGRISAIGTEFFGNDCVACQPAYKWKQVDFEIWLDKISEFCQNGETGVYAENALNLISDKVNLYPMELERRLCNEIDDLNDLLMIKEKFQQIF
jgi:phosphoenolpyruvate phosphomutase